MEACAQNILKSITHATNSFIEIIRAYFIYYAFSLAVNNVYIINFELISVLTLLEITVICIGFRLKSLRLTDV